MLERVKKVLEKVRPSLQADGGDVKLISVEDNVVKVQLTGACGGCPFSQMTLWRKINLHSYYYSRKFPVLRGGFCRYR